METSRGRLLRVAAVLAAALLPSAFVEVGRADATAEAEHRKTRDELLPKLRVRAEWCDKQQIYAERDRACEGIVALEPDDPAARRTLKYTRTKDGKWKRGIVPKPSPIDPARAAEVQARHEEAFGTFRASALGLVGASDAAVDVRERALEELIGVEPDCADARSANRETRVKDVWVLDETIAAKERRKELLAAIGAAKKAGATPEKSAPTAEETEICPTWTDVRETGPLRVLAGPKVGEAEGVARAADVVFSTYESVTGANTSSAIRRRLYLFASIVDGFAAVDRDPRLTDDDRKWARSLACFPAPKTDDVYIWSVDAPTRIEWGLRQVVVAQLWPSFSVGDKPVWVREGLCHWYSEALLGTHFCYFSRRSEYADAVKKADDLHKRLSESSSDWLGEARDLEKGTNWPDLRVSLACDANAASAQDVLASYVLVRYLVEGRPDLLPDVFRSVGRGERPDAWIASRFGATVEGFDRRLRRWVRESK